MNRPISRSFMALVIVAAWAATTSPSYAAHRTPQVPVLGGSLQAFFNGQSETINVQTDQDSVQIWRSAVSNNPTYTVQIELVGNASGSVLGFYNPAVLVPVLYPIFPALATTGWFAVVSFRPAPVRALVNLFDANANFLGTRTYLDADKNAFGFYLEGAGGTFYTQDARNPDGAPQALVYAGTGINSGQWWLCWEDVAFGGGSDHDFDDSVLFIEPPSGCFGQCPVKNTSWARLKERFR